LKIQINVSLLNLISGQSFMRKIVIGNFLQALLLIRNFWFTLIVLFVKRLYFVLSLIWYWKAYWLK